MITAQMKKYEYFAYSDSVNEYGENELQTQSRGTVKMAINAISDSIVDNPLYKDATYIGLTFNFNLNDSNIIAYGKEKLKVLYVKPFGRYNQVYLGRMQ